MLKMTELRDKMIECLQGKIEFTTTELKRWLEECGYKYNIDYSMNSFSNAVASLTKQKYIISLDTERKGNYRVIYNDQNKDYIKEQLCEEQELKNIREMILELLKKNVRDIEELLDTEKMSTYRKNHKTYDDIMRLLEYFENFKFTIDK